MKELIVFGQIVTTVTGVSAKDQVVQVIQQCLDFCPSGYSHGRCLLLSAEICNEDQTLPDRIGYHFDVNMIIPSHRTLLRSILRCGFHQCQDCSHISSFDVARAKCERPTTGGIFYYPPMRPQVFLASTHHLSRSHEHILLSPVR